uniref:Uncharacterized protein n=1 Tax=Globisporangium ultimum (strain ATCC 200006 / CBS 805.95 / DAOM BR144) TaxID=431595 RepID=K3X1L0_GLOUD
MAHQKKSGPPGHSSAKFRKVNASNPELRQQVTSLDVPVSDRVTIYLLELEGGKYYVGKIKRKNVDE